MWLNMGMNELENEFLSIKEFAAKVNVHANTIRRAIKSGRIQAFRIGGGKKSSYRIPKSEIGRIALFDMEEMIDRIVEKRLQEIPKSL
jgi:excisionase family DNA binding protein